MKKQLFLLASGLTLFFANCKNPASTTIKAADTLAADSNSSWALLPFTNIDSANPVLEPGTGRFLIPFLKKKLTGRKKTCLILPL